MKRKSFVWAAFAFTWLLTGCSESFQSRYFSPNNEQMDDQMSGWGRKATRNALLKVTDIYGKPVAGAQVLIGDSLNQPFNSNFLTTDANGTFQAPAGWTGLQPVTVAAEGFVRTTYYGQIPAGQTFQMRWSKVPVTYELKGSGTGFQVKDSDNLIDFALMVPTVKRGELFSFNLQMFISPQSDIVDVYGQKIALPSNVSLPRQRENLGFVPVTLQKPVYRMYFDSLGKQRVMTIRGQFPFKQVVNELQNNKSFIDVINYFSLKGGSLTDVEITQTSQIKDLPVNSLVFNSPRAFQSPAFQSDEFLLAVALSPYQGELLPTDFKNVPANTSFNLVTAQGDTPQLLVALKKKSEQEAISSGKLSAALVTFDTGVKPSLLPLIEKPEVVSLTELKLSSRLAQQDVSPVATYLVLSSVSKQGTSETTQRLWEVYAKGWQYDLRLPQWPGEEFDAGTKRWEMTLLGTQDPKNKAVDLSPRMLETVTHATHSATDF